MVFAFGEGLVFLEMAGDGIVRDVDGGGNAEPFLRGRVDASVSRFPIFGVSVVLVDRAGFRISRFGMSHHLRSRGCRIDE